MIKNKMNVVELLMTEHASLRLHFQYARKTANWDSIYELEDFVRNCHARCEDEVIFPQLQKELLGSSNQETLKILSRALAKQIIQDFGLNRYFQITGISEKLLDSVH